MSARSRDQSPDTDPPWEFLEGQFRPPLLQALAPHPPPDKGIQHLQHERQQWRRAWVPYAQSLRDLAEKMLEDERTRQLTTQGDEMQVIKLEETLRCIEDDIFDVLAANPDIDGNTGPRAARPRTTPSYMGYSASVLEDRLTGLQRIMGHGQNPHWPNGPHSTRVYGQDYPGDEFREILYYKPAKEKPTNWRLRWASISSFLPKTWLPEVHFLFRVLVVLVLLWVLVAAFSSVVTIEYRFSDRIRGSSVRGGTSSMTGARVVADVVYSVSGTMKQISPQGAPE